MAEKWTNIGSISSETSKGTKYGIDVNEDGTLLRCHCMSYVHSKAEPKECKHTLSSEAGRLLHNHQSTMVPARYTYIGTVLTTYLRPGETYRQGLYSGPAAVISKTDLDKLSVLVNEAKNLTRSSPYAPMLHGLRYALRAMGLTV